MNEVVYEGLAIHEQKVVKVKVLDVTEPDRDGKRIKIELLNPITGDTLFSRIYNVSGSYLAENRMSDEDLYRLLIQFRNYVPDRITTNTKNAFRYPVWSRRLKIHETGKLIEVYFLNRPGDTLNAGIIRNSSVIEFFEILEIFQYFYESGVLSPINDEGDEVKAQQDWHKKLSETLERLKPIVNEDKNGATIIPKPAEAEASTSDPEVIIGETPVEYKLFETVGVTIGQDVVKFINSRQTNIKIIYSGKTSIIWTDQPPYSEGNIEVSDERISDTKGLSIILDNTPTSHPCLVRNKLAVLSNGALRGTIDVQDLPYYTYFTALAILQYESEIRFNVITRVWPRTGPHGFKIYISDAALPPNYIDALGPWIETDERLKGIIEGIRAIARAAASIHNRDNLDDADTEPAENQTQETTTVTSDASISKTIGTAVHFGVGEKEIPEDALGYKEYANAIGDLIIHEKTETPLTICIGAPWGMGKTTLMDFIKERIKGHEHILPINFNAWKYANSEEIWATFYSKIIGTIEERLGRLNKLLFNWNVLKHCLPKSWLIRIFLLLITVGIVIWGLRNLYCAVIDLPEIQINNFSTHAPIIGTIITLAVLAWASFLSISKLILGKFKKAPYPIPPNKQNDVLLYFEKICSWFEKKINKRKSNRIKNKKSNLFMKPIHERFIVFIDDLDRCRPEQILNILEAIKLFLDTQNFIFILAMDARVVRHAVGTHYKFMAETIPEQEIMRYDYLEKIIQIPFSLPQLNPIEILNHKNQLLADLVEHPQEEKHDERPKPKKDNEPTIKANRSMPIEIQGDPNQALFPIKQDDTLEMSLSEAEDKTIEEIINNGITPTPRQMVRFKNVYLLARHLYLEKFASHETPPCEFTIWILLLVVYPFEIRRIKSQCDVHGWNTSWSEITKQILEFCKRDKKDIDRELQDYNKLEIILKDKIPEPIALEKFQHITDCFNLVLD
ncbi:MAG: P-loop NTPase fold protein [Candidatus Zixiibacteriota bacterium]